MVRERERASVRSRATQSEPRGGLGLTAYDRARGVGHGQPLVAGGMVLQTASEEDQQMILAFFFTVNFTPIPYIFLSLCFSLFFVGFPLFLLFLLWIFLVFEPAATLWPDLMAGLLLYSILLVSCHHEARKAGSRHTAVLLSKKLLLSRTPRTCLSLCCSHKY